MKRFFLYLLLGGSLLLTACNWTSGGVLKKLGGLLETLEQTEDQARSDADRARHEQEEPAVNMTPFELTYFTDRPTAQDIPDTRRSDNPADQLKKQLQGQLDAIRQ